MSSAPRDDNVVFLSFRGAHTGAAICDTINLRLIFFEPAVHCKGYFLYTTNAFTSQHHKAKYNVKDVPEASALCYSLNSNSV
jgi:hypothetical protein